MLNFSWYLLHIVISTLIKIHQIIHVMMDGQINEEYWRRLCVLPMDFPVLIILVRKSCMFFLTSDLAVHFPVSRIHGGPQLNSDPWRCGMKVGRLTPHRNFLKHHLTYLTDIKTISMVIDESFWSILMILFLNFHLDPYMKLIFM